MITISYSVNGGWNPIEYKSIADELAYKLNYYDKTIVNRIMAGKIFLKYAKMKNNKSKLANKYLKMALALNPNLKSNNLTKDPLYLMKGNIKNAIKEFKTVLDITPEDVLCLIGCGAANLIAKKLTVSRSYFNRIVKIDPNNEVAIIYLASIDIIKKNTKLQK